MIQPSSRYQGVTIIPHEDHLFCVRKRGPFEDIKLGLCLSHGSNSCKNELGPGYNDVHYRFYNPHLFEPRYLFVGKI